MKLKSFSISLLLAFIVMLSHQVIPHHHHDSAIDGVASFHIHDTDQYCLLDNVGNNNHEDSDDSHHHNLPPHEHNLISGDYNFTSLTKEYTVNHKVSSESNLYISINDSLEVNLYCLEKHTYPDAPLPLIISHKSGTVGLRAPPALV